MAFTDLPLLGLMIAAACGVALLAGVLLPRPPGPLQAVYGSNGQAGHMPVLEMYRGLLALVVAMSHSMAFPLFREDALLGNLTALDGRKAVAFFCVISGFVIYRSCRNLGGSPEALRHYAIRRALRILPILFLAVALSLLVTGNVGPALIASELSLIGIFGLDPVATANPTLWSIYPEILFYGLAPVIVALAGRTPVAFLLIAAGVLTLGDRSTDSHGIHVWKYFMLGMAVSALEQMVGPRMSRWARRAMVLGGAALIVSDLSFGDLLGGAWVAMFDGAQQPLDRESLASVFSVGIGLGCALVILGTVRSAGANAVARRPVFGWLGAISYPFFALHQVVYVFTFGWTFEAPRSLSGEGAVTFLDSPFGTLAAILLATLALATLVHLAVERPFMQLGRRIARSPEAGPQAASERSSVPEFRAEYADAIR
jgi:peptidoglycan/LPS O-acetylase OafA/YrhL